MDETIFKKKAVDFREKIAEINSTIEEEKNNPNENINYARKINQLKEELAEISKDMYKDTKFK